jgi:pimeloyl-ACP methyl ester carboxylesterase
MPTIETNRVRIYYEEKGSGEPVVFVHGIPTDYRAWGAQVDALSRRYRVVTLSRRYAAPNVREGDVSDSTVGNNGADLKGFIDRLDAGPVHLVGHSYGGFVAAYIAADHPDVVKSLVLVEPAISTLLVKDQTSSTQLLGLLLRSPSIALSGRRFQNGSLAPSLRALDAGETEKAVMLNVDGVQDSKGAFGQFPETSRKMMIDNARTIAELRTQFPRFTHVEAGMIRSKTLVVNGERTALWLRRIGELMAKAVPGARSVKVTQARHFPHMENPAEFNDKVLAFLGEAS